MGQAWIDLLMMVNHEDRKVLFNGDLVTVKRGSCITSLRKLAERWRRNKRTVSRYLDLLEADGMITQKRDSKCTTINVVNYCVYQGFDRKSGTVNAPQSAPHTAPHTAPLTAPKQETRNTIEERKEEYTLLGDPTDTRPWWEQEEDETDLPVQP